MAQGPGAEGAAAAEGAAVEPPAPIGLRTWQEQQRARRLEKEAREKAERDEKARVKAEAKAEREANQQARADAAQASEYLDLPPDLRPPPPLANEGHWAYQDRIRREAGSQTIGDFIRTEGGIDPDSVGPGERAGYLEEGMGSMFTRAARSKSQIGRGGLTRAAEQKGANAEDTMLDSLIQRGHLPEGTTEDGMWNAIREHRLVDEQERWAEAEARREEYRRQRDEQPDNAPKTGNAGVDAALAELRADPDSLAGRALDAALGNLGVDPADPKPAEFKPRDVAGRLAAAWIEAERLARGEEFPDAELGPLERALKAAGAEPVGERGATVAFDGKLHRTTNPDVNTGDPVVVERPGWVMKEKDGATYRLVEAKVEPAGDAAEGGGAASGTPGADPLGFDFGEFLRGESGHYWFPGPEVFREMGRRLFGRRRGKDPDFAPDADPNPDNPRALPPENIVRRAAFNQLGAYNATRPEVATTAHAWARHASDQVANAWALSHAQLDAAFPVDPKTGDVPLAGGRRGFMEDVIREELANPGSQPLTPEQANAVKVWRGVWEKQLAAMEREGVRVFRDADGNEIPVADLLKKGYFPRTAVQEPEVVGLLQSLIGYKGAASGTAAPGKPGARPGYRQQRKFDTEAAGVAGGVRYKTSFADRVADFIKATNREIADTRLANDPLLGGTDVIQPFFKRLLAQNKAVLDLLPRAARDELTRRLHGLASLAATGNVFVAPAFRGREYSPEVKRHLEAMYGERGGRVLTFANAISQELRSLVLSLDASFATLQLQGMMFSNPVRFVRVIGRGLQSFFTPDLLPRLVRERPEYRQAVDEITQSSGTIGSLPEQLGGGSGRQSLVGSLPLFKQTQRMFSTVMDLAKIELWIANRPADPKQWPRAVEALENSLGGGRMEQTGMSPERALLERLTVLAPAYYRGFVNLARQAGQGGAGGRIARKQLGSMLGGVLLTGIAGLYAAKEAGWITDDEFEERINPARGKFLTVPVRLGATGKSAEIGFGGFYMSIMRTLGNAHAWEKGEQTDNPFVKWYRNHAGVLPRLGWDLATGKDNQGNPVTPATAAGRALLPVAAQNVALDPGTPEQGGFTAAAGLVGLRSFPGSESGEHVEGLRKYAARQGKVYSQLSLPEQAAMLKRYERENPKPATQPSPGQVDRAVAAAAERQKRVTAAVSPDTRDRLKQLEKALPSYDAKLAINGAEVPLTRDQQRRYESLLAEEYDRSVKNWPVDTLKRAPAKQRADWMERQLEMAKDRAKRRLVQESVRR